jgi:hypothetical protein
MAMNIQNVKTNLEKTIAGKEELLKHVRAKMLYEDVTGNVMANRATHDFLEINIAELKRILQDVEQCEPSLPGEGYNYEKWDGDE